MLYTTSSFSFSVMKVFCLLYKYLLTANIQTPTFIIGWQLENVPCWFPSIIHNMQKHLLNLQIRGLILLPNLFLKFAHRICMMHLNLFICFICKGWFIIYSRQGHHKHIVSITMQDWLYCYHFFCVPLFWLLWQKVSGAS